MYIWKSLFNNRYLGINLFSKSSSNINVLFSNFYFLPESFSSARITWCPMSTRVMEASLWDGFTVTYAWVLWFSHIFMFVSWFGQSKFRVTLTLSSPWGLHHLHVILFSSMASWLTFARALGLGLSWSPFLDSAVILQLPAGAGPAASASMPRFVQPKGIGQFGSSYRQQSVNSFSPLCL